jgi:hypothetical protein
MSIPKRCRSFFVPFVSWKKKKQKNETFLRLSDYYLNIPLCSQSFLISLYGDTYAFECLPLAYLSNIWFSFAVFLYLIVTKQQTQCWTFSKATLCCLRYCCIKTTPNHCYLRCTVRQVWSLIINEECHVANENFCICKLEYLSLSPTYTPV